MAVDTASISLSLAGWLSAATFAYLAAGAVFAAFFFFLGIARVDPATHGSSFFFRLLIAPATIVLWPFLLRAWRRSSRESP